MSSATWRNSSRLAPRQPQAAAILRASLSAALVSQVLLSLVETRLKVPYLFLLLTNDLQGQHQGVSSFTWGLLQVPVVMAA